PQTAPVSPAFLVSGVQHLPHTGLTVTAATCLPSHLYLDWEHPTSVFPPHPQPYPPSIFTKDRRHLSPQPSAGLFCPELSTRRQTVTRRYKPSIKDRPRNEC
ncbi:BarH-like 1 homeobox protein, partial [Araneus ventricosus]